MSTIYGDGFVADRWHEREVAKDAARLSDAANYADRRLREAEYTDTRTKAARAAIEGLGRNLTELEVMAIVSALMAGIEKCGWSHTQEAVTAVEYLRDVHSVLEQGAE